MNTMRKIVAHKGCSRSEVTDGKVRGVYAYAKVYMTTEPTVEDNQITFDECSITDSPYYVYQIECYDCGQTVIEFNEEVESYKLDYAFRNYPDDYNVEVIEVS